MNGSELELVLQAVEAWAVGAYDWRLAEDKPTPEGIWAYERALFLALKAARGDMEDAADG